MVVVVENLPLIAWREDREQITIAMVSALLIGLDPLQRGTLLIRALLKEFRRNPQDDVYVAGILLPGHETAVDPHLHVNPGTV
jgi:hypothetical protein